MVTTTKMMGFITQKMIIRIIIIVVTYNIIPILNSCRYIPHYFVKGKTLTTMKEQMAMALIIKELTSY